MLRHMKKAHRPPRLFTCTACDKVFKNQSSFFFHFKTTHVGSGESSVQQTEGVFENLLKFEANYSETDVLGPVQLNSQLSDDEEQEKPEILPDDMPLARDEENRAIREVFDLSCKMCPKLHFETWSELRGHTKDIHGMEKFSIRCCNRSFRKRCRIVDHALGHTNPMRLKCSICMRVCSDRNTLRAHWKTHEGERFFCDLCSRGFNTKGSVKAHMQTHVSTETKQELLNTTNFTCDTCGKGFALKSFLDRHTSRAHNKASICVCDVCAKTFRSRQTFLIHRKTVHGDPDSLRVKCPECNKWMLNSECLRKHTYRIHGPGPHICEVCGKELSTKHTLRLHYQYHHPTGDLHKCDFEACKKVFRTTGQLKEHKQRHLGIFSSCKYCNMTFKSKCSMYKHRKKMHPAEVERDRGRDVVYNIPVTMFPEEPLIIIRKTESF